MTAITRAIAPLSALLLLVGCERMETVDIAYPDLATAVKAEAVGDDKWIPTFLPPSATHIRDVHNLDTNEQWLTFRFNLPDWPALARARKPVPAKDIASPRRSLGTWWPKELTRVDKDREQDEKGYEYYACKERSAMAVARERREAYYWTGVE